MPDLSIASAKAQEPLNFKTKALQVECRFGANKRLAGKTEHFGGNTDRYEYVFDQKGHLTEVHLNGLLTEEYQYNEKGQRIRRYSRHTGKSEDLTYDQAGRLAANGEREYSYNKDGSLKTRWQGAWLSHEGRKSEFEYDGTRLLSAKLPDGTIIRYEYAATDAQNQQRPIKKLRNGQLAAEYAWLDLVRLDSCRDYEQGLEFKFYYGKRHCPDKLVILRRQRRSKTTAQPADRE